MNFKQYLSVALMESKSYENEAALVLQKIVDMIDHGHVDYSNDRISFNVGQLIKKGVYRHLNVVIRKKASANVRFGLSAKGEMTIVVDTTSIPEREKIDTFLSRASTAEKFKAAFIKYLEYGHDHDNDNEIEPTSYEKVRAHNERGGFENNYAKLMSKAEENIDQFNKAVAHVEEQLKDTGVPSQKEMLKLSVANLAKELVGVNAKDFTRILMSLPEAEFVASLQGDMKKKFQSRVENYFEHKIAPLLKKMQ